MEWRTCCNNYSRWAKFGQWPSLIMHGITYLVQISTTWQYSSMSPNTKLIPKHPVHLLYWLTFDKCCNSIYSLSHQPILHLKPSHHACTILYCNKGDAAYPHMAYSTSYSNSIMILHKTRAQRYTTCSWHCSKLVTVEFWISSHSYIAHKGQN